MAIDKIKKKQYDKEYSKKYYINNKEKLKARSKEWKNKNIDNVNQAARMWRLNNPIKSRESVRKYRNKNRKKVMESNKKWHLKNKERRRCYMKKYNAQYYPKRRKSDPLFKLKYVLSGRIRQVMKSGGYTKSNKLHQILGCSLIFFKEYIEIQFKRGMTWDNHGRWHYDHIIPLASAKTKEDVIALNHYTNFQPLWEKENKEKGAKTMPTQLILL